MLVPKKCHGAPSLLVAVAAPTLMRTRSEDQVNIFTEKQSNGCWWWKESDGIGYDFVRHWIRKTTMLTICIYKLELINSVFVSLLYNILSGSFNTMF
ncbi:unnamed protein product [Eruca vesicaria subsp. sativa]|uniref:Uncharacterized protein n=1 Tax=Eruca vesicaria subsp. sativa TaxID=29727 RepID=A0ABC8K2R6_ERUVS|nr:unnamed protein product [Eruca vesicaria subsp. sativa]